MQGNKKVIEALNMLLEAEYAGTIQYIVENGVVSNWGYGRLSEEYMKRAKDEMRHIDLLIDRLFFLEGVPVTAVAKIFVGADVPDQLNNDHLIESNAIANYNEAINICTEANDNDTKELLESILADETRHINEIENNRAQVAQIGLPIFLSTKIG